MFGDQLGQCMEKEVGYCVRVAGHTPGVTGDGSWGRGGLLSLSCGG